MSTYSPRHQAASPRASDDFRIEFEGDVLPAPVTRLASGVDDGGEGEEDFESRLARTQEELLQLQHQARVVERRKEELEEMTRKEREYTRGRAELHEKLSAILVMLERSSGEAQRQLEVLLQARDDLSRHYRALTAIVIEDWNAPGVAEQADHALAVINDARADYERVSARTAACLGVGGAAAMASSSDTVGQDFRYWLRSGFAFTLPLVVLGAVALVLSLVL
ncbi:MAG: hypothetical protein ACKV19_26585 [Verrucomicrobiales bacterium]